MRKGDALLTIHPFLFALFPALSLYVHNIGQVPLRQLIAPLSIILLLTLIGFILLRIIFRNSLKTAPYYSAFILLFFSYGHLYDFLGNSSIGRSNSEFYSTVILLIAFVGAVYIISRKSADPTGINKFMTLASCILLIVPIMNIVVFNSTETSTAKKTDAAEKPAAVSADPGNTEAYPNIYYIILDAYGREDILGEFFGFDNSGFINRLNRRGFFVARKSHSNYSETRDSIPSSLNSQYLFSRTKSDDYLDRIKRDNSVAKFLKERGYTILRVATTCENVDLSEDKDLVRPGYAITEFDNRLLYSTPIPIFLTGFHIYDPFDLYRENLSHTFDYVAQSPQIKGPFFLFVHFGIPHPPFVFGENGEPIAVPREFADNDGFYLIRNGRLTAEEYVRHYTDQLIYLNERVIEMIDAVLENSSQPPIIILQGDHGPRSTLRSWTSAEETDLRENLSILNAFHLPGNGRELLYDGITPVNSFRIVLNRYFNTHYTLLEDRTYFRTHGKDRDAFVEVTDRLGE